MESRDGYKYDPSTGHVYGRRGKSPLGSYDKDGYLCTTFHGKVCKVHRLAFYIVNGEWPELTVDHKDGVRDNNTWGNLRLATRAQQVQNQRKGTLKGVRVLGGKYQARITVDGCMKYLGVYLTMGEAQEAYDTACYKYFGDFAAPAGG